MDDKPPSSPASIGSDSRLLIGGALVALAVVAGFIIWRVSTGSPTAEATLNPPPASATTEPTTEPTLSLEPSPSPVPTAVPTASPTPEPELAFTPPPGVLPWGAVVAADAELQLYERPADPSTPTLVAAVGERFTIFGPLMIEGERWYELRSVDDPTGSGYAALDPTGDDVSIEPVTCPDTVTATATPGIPLLASLSGWERLSCFGDTTLTLEGVEITGFGGFRPGSWEPEWLNGYLGTFALAEPDETGVFADFLFVSVAPGVDATRPPIADGSLVGTELLRVTGHFNHPASTECTVTGIPITDDLEGPTADYETIAAEIGCRQVFVVTGLEVVSDV